MDDLTVTELFAKLEAHLTEMDAHLTKQDALEAIMLQLLTEQQDQLVEICRALHASTQALLAELRHRKS